MNNEEQEFTPNFVNSSNFDANDPSYVVNYIPDRLYKHEFGNKGGKYFSVVSDDDEGRPEEIEIGAFTTRYKLRLTYIKDRNDISDVLITKYKIKLKGKNKGEWEMDQTEGIRFSGFSFDRIVGLLKFLTSLDLGSLEERRITLAEDSFGSINEETSKQIKALLAKEDGGALIKEVIESGIITSSDIVNLGYRKAQLQIFTDLLNDPSFLLKYAEENKLTDKKPEKVWQFFFKKNEWIFGYGLDYRYLSIIQDEAHLSDTNISGKDGVIGDFLMGCSDFTTLVEIKRPDTELFEASKNRAGSWQLSKDLIYSVSQILEQKASWQVKSQTEQFDLEGNPILQKTIDPKAILLIGRSEQHRGEEQEQKIKAKTFELFCRDSRNIEIITFDQLYNRASFIVEHQKTV